MNDPGRDFRDRLLRAEPVTPSLKDRYEKEIQAMLEKPLSGAGRGVWLLSALGGVAIAVLFAASAVFLPEPFPWLGRLGFAVGAVFAIGWAVLGWRILRRGAMHLKADTGLASGLVWGFVVFNVTIFMLIAPDNLTGLRMIVIGLVFLVGGAVFLLRHVVELTELKTREKLLEIELRLVELADNVKPQAGSRQQDA